MANDQELLYMFRMGYPASEEALFLQYRGYLISLVNKALEGGSRYQSVRDEMLLEARIGLIDAARRYREDQTACWLTFLTLVIKRRLVNVMRHYDIQRSWNTTPLVSLDNFIAENESIYEVVPQNDRLAEPDYHYRFVEAIETYEQVVNTMNEKEKMILALMQDGATWKEGEQQLSLSKKSWYRQCNKIKQRIIEAWGN